MNFVHLHLHTQYSLLDGAITVEALCKKVKEFGMSAVAITDHGNLFGAMEFYTKANKLGLQPIIGCEVYIQPQGSRTDRQPRKGHEPYNHLTLLAMNRKGYQNLCRLVTAGYLEGFYYKPRIDKELLAEQSEGLVALSGCLSGELAEAAMAGGLPQASKVVDEYRKIFGDRFYLEVQRNEIPEQVQVNGIIDQLSQKLSLPIVATADCHYLEKKDAPAHEALLCIQTGKTLQDEDRMRFRGDDFYVKSTEEMAKLFEDRPDALSVTVEIAKKCQLEFDSKTYHFPKFEPPAGKTLDQFLEELVWQGFNDRWSLISKASSVADREKYVARIRDELKMISQMGFAGYFLIVADFINYAKQQKIPVGPGRGSAAGSLVAYCLKITDIDPMPYGLLFERFLNPERISMPDMDIDFCIRGRDKVLKYVQEKYGNVGQIITFGKMKARAVVRDVGRVMNMSYGEVDRIAKLVPNTLGITLAEAVKQEPRLHDLEQNDPRVRRLLEYGRSLEGLTRHASTHAAGVVISDRPLVDFVPLYRGQQGEIVTQFDMKSIEEIGLIKFDFLGLKTLTVIDEALKIIRRTRGMEIRIIEIPLDDPLVYQRLSAGDTYGIFQLESRGMRDLITKLRPSAFPDLIALVALYRPGPLGSGMVDDFINRKHGRVPMKYELPELEPILSGTYGVIVYQEQVMKIAATLAHFSLGDADILRRAMGKKNSAEMAEQKDKFLKGCREKKVPPKKAEKIFDLMAKFAEYGFNLSHSAAYALIAYQTAWLKTHYTVEYMASLLTFEMGNTDKVMTYMNDCRTYGIAVLPPDINESFSGFTVVGEKQIRFGLAAVKHVGGAAIESIVEGRIKAGKFRSFVHFCEMIDHRKVNRRVVESLIKCGAFDSLGISRAQAFAALGQALERGARLQKDEARGQAPLFDLSPSSVGTTNGDPVVEWGTREKLTFEKESLGFFISGHPLTEYEALVRERATVDSDSLRESPDGKEIAMGGIVASLREITTKSGDRMGFVRLEDLKGSVEVIVFPELYKTTQILLKGDLPILVKGHIDIDEETVKVIAREVVPLAKSQSVHVRLSATRVTRDQLENLKKLLRTHRGPSLTYLHLIDEREGETVLSLPEDLRVDPSADLIREVDSLFGSPVTLLE